MATFSNIVYNTYSQITPNASLSLSGVNNSVVFEASSAWENPTYVLNVSVFTGLSGAQVHLLSSNPLFSKQTQYWGQMSTVGWQLSSPALTPSQYLLLSGIYASHASGYLANRFVQVTSAFIQQPQVLGGYFFDNTSSQEVVGVMYNAISGTATATINMPDCVRLRVAQEYHGSQMALVFANRSSSLFTVNTAISAVQALSGLTFNNQSPEDRRRFVLNG